MTTTTTTTLPAPPPPPAPAILRFTQGAPPAGLLCSVGSPKRLAWTSQNADSASLLLGGVTRSGGPTDAINLCATGGQAATLAVSGPGGTDTATNTTR